MRSQSVTSVEPASRSQNATLKRGRNIKYRPYAFSEHGAVMAATILNTPRAMEVSVFVVRAFVRLSQFAANYRQLALKLAEIEAKVASHDKSFQMVFSALRKLMQPPEPKKKRIGFATGPDDNIVAHDRPRSARRRRP